MRKSRINKTFFNEFIKWAIVAQIFSFIAFVIALRILYNRDDSGDAHLLYKLFKDLTSRGEAIVFFIPAFCGLYLELDENKVHSKKYHYIFIVFFLVLVIVFMVEYVLIVAEMLKNGSSILVHVIIPLLLLNISAFIVKLVPNKEKDGTEDTINAHN